MVIFDKLAVALITVVAQGRRDNPDLDFRPDPNALPGNDVVRGLVNGLMNYGLIAAAIGMIGGLLAWGLGSRTNNHDWTSSGKRAVLVAVMVAFGIAATGALIEFFYVRGREV
jgi:hypothetical protein